MSLALTEIERVKTISKEEFYTNYVKKQKPVVLIYKLLTVTKMYLRKM